MTLTVNGKTTTGTVTGRLFVYADDKTAETVGLSVTFGDKTLVLKFRGTVVDATPNGKTTTYKITGQYAFDGASEFGLADHGDLDATFRTGSSLSFDLRGRASS